MRYLAAVICKALCFVTGALGFVLLARKYYWALWFNPEDGWDVPGWYTFLHPDRPDWLNYYIYHAWRNPGAGMRNYRWYSPEPRPERITWKGNIAGAHRPPERGRWFWFYAKDGDYWGFYLGRLWKKRWLDCRIGWKVSPNDKKKLSKVKAEHGYGFTAFSLAIHRRVG